MMRNTIRTVTVILACLAAALFVAACKSPPPPSMEGLSAAEIFQRAQDEAEKGNSEQAIRYYEAYKQMRPDDRARGAWASYEIAFLYHKMKNDELALKLFDELLAQYTAGGSDLPPGPRILAEKLKASIEQSRAPRAPAVPAKS